jgi:glycosyltransferase involved in cell wall biosynthesis
MRILIIVDCYYPSSKSSAKLIYDLGTELHQQGHQVTVLTPSEHNAKGLELSTENRLLIARVKTGKIKGASKLFRAFREVRLSATLWRKGNRFFRENPCDLIILYSPSIFFGSLVRKLKLLWGCPVYLILRDIFPQWVVDAGVLRKGLVYQFFHKKELEQYRAADIIGVQSPANLEYLARQPQSKNYNLEVLYNWASLHDLPNGSTSYREQLNLQGKVVFFFGGNIGVAQDVDNILRLASSLRDEQQIHFLLVGEGSEAERLEASIAAKGLTNIQLLPPVGQQAYVNMLAEFDVGLVSLDRRLKTQNFPGKILGYMASSLPILCSINPGNDLASMIEAHEAGLCCLNGSDEFFRAHALTLARDVMLRRRMGQNARRLLEQFFSVTSVTNQILSHFREAPVVEYADFQEIESRVSASSKGN